MTPLSVLKYNIDDFSHTQGPQMVHERWNFACTIFNSPAHNGRPVVIVAGWVSGAQENIFGEDTPEIWDFTQAGSSWKQSKFIFHLTV